jgi:hypothetical protein
VRVAETKEYPQADLQTPRLSSNRALAVDEDEEDDEEEDVEEEEEVVDPEDEEVVEERDELDVVDVLPVDDREVLVVDDDATDAAEEVVEDVACDVDNDPGDTVEEVVEDVACDVDDDPGVVAGVLDDVATLVVLWLDVEEPEEFTAWYKLGSGRWVKSNSPAPASAANPTCATRRPRRAVCDRSFMVAAL